MSDILVIEDDPAIKKLISRTLGQQGHKVHNSHTLQEGLNLARAGSFTVIFLDIYLPDGNGLEAAPDLIDLQYKPEIVIITGQKEPNGVRFAYDSGVFDYLKKPFGLDELRLTCRRAIEFREARIQSSNPGVIEYEGLVGSSALMKDCLKSAAKAAAGQHNILITGETGAGKELMAKSVHLNSSRAEKNFIIVDCAALKDTLLESTLFGHERGAFTGAEARKEGLVALADQGTLFLDEIGELNIEAQKRFLRLLEEKRFYPLGAKKEQYSDFRLVAATNKDLEEMSRQGEFRTDLYYRICGQEIRIPPLRERPEDIRDLVCYYVEKICSRMQISVKRVYPELLEALAGFNWPGNVRELFNSLDEAITSFPEDPALHVRHLPSRLRIAFSEGNAAEEPAPSYPVQEEAEPGSNRHLPDWKSFRKQAVDAAEKKYFHMLFSGTGGDVKKIAALSGLTRARVYDMIKKHSLIVSEN